MITKITSKVQIHFFFYIAAMIAIITGQFRLFFFFFCIVTIHEIGHIVGAIFYGWNIEKVILLPFGGLTLFHEKLNRPIQEEFVITILGPLFQIIFCSFFHDKLFFQCHIALLFFNLLPIFPLDGSKLFHLACSLFFSFKTSHTISLFLSFLLLAVLSFLNFVSFQFILVLILFFLFLKTWDEKKKHRHLYHKFLMERYLYRFHFPKTKIIRNQDYYAFFRDYYHLFYVDGHYLTEEYILSKMFDNTSIL